jgi:3-oxoacyl-[acyl-carrier protein] reductase
MEKSVYIITGASRGIGRAIAYRLASPNSIIVLNHFDPDESEAQKTMAEVQNRGATAKVLYFDVSSAEETNRHIDDVINEYGRIDVLVNNAGIAMDSLFLRMKDTQWEKVLAVNLTGAYNCSKAVCRAMVKQRSGKIVNISSVVGAIGNVGQANYAASKAGLMGLTKTLAKELGPWGITVNAVAPGFIDTEMTQNLPEKVKALFLQSIPLGRMGTPDEVADLVAFLISEQSRYITGQVIHINGGLYG